MTDSIGDRGDSANAGDDSEGGAAGDSGPDQRGSLDPVIGAGVALFGIFLMSMGGARDAHYVFDVGVLTAVLGAGTFVLFVALSAMRQRPGPKDGGQPS